MEKTIFKGAKSHFPCSTWKTYDVALVSKTKVDTLKGFQTLKGCKEPAGGIFSQGHSNGVQREVDTPVVLSYGGGPMEGVTRSSPALRGSGKAHILPLFHGLDYKEFASWIYAIECCFGVDDFSEIEKCDMVVSCLRNDALKWYNDVICANKKSNRTKFKYWHKLKCCLRAKFLNESIMISLCNELENLQQGSLGVENYTKLFNELSFMCGKSNDTFERRTHYYNGLNSEVQTWINVEETSSFELLCELALYSETLINEHEIYVECLAKYDAIAAAFMSYSNGDDNEVSLTQGVIFDDHEAVLESVTVQVSVPRTVITQGAVLGQKLDHKPDFFDKGCSSSYLVSQNIKGHTYNLNECLLGLESTQRGLSVTKGNFGVDLHHASCELGALNSDFPWECWSTKGDIEAIDGANSTKGIQRQGNHIYLNLGLKSCVLIVMLLRPRVFLLVFDPGGF